MATFSYEVKKEIMRSVRSAKGCCATAFLRAVLKSCGSLSLSEGKFSYVIESDNEPLLKLCLNLARDNLQVDGEMITTSLGVKGDIYGCEFPPELGEKTGLALRDSDGGLNIAADAESIIPNSDCCKVKFMQGLFVSRGSVVVPVVEMEDGEDAPNANYHLELRFTDYDLADAVFRTYVFFPFHIAKRKNHTVLYLKDSEKIADFLVYVNAMSAKLKLENVMVIRSVRNDTNRSRNCILANIDKSIDACGKQLEDIKRIRAKGLFDTLPEPLKDIAVMREQNPDASLSDIAAMLNISKSGATHRFAKLKEWANK